MPDLIGMGHPGPLLLAAEAYHPRTPQDSPLWNQLDRHFDEFTTAYDERFATDYGFFRPVVSEVVHDYLKCGDLTHGFARVRCPDWGYKPRRIPSPTWRECIKKIWEVDPLTCPHCQAEMKIISFISEPKLVRKILEHLKLWVHPSLSGGPPPARATPLPDHDPAPPDEITYVPIDDGWPQYEEPFIAVD